MTNFEEFENAAGSDGEIIFTGVSTNSTPYDVLLDINSKSGKLEIVAGFGKDFWEIAEKFFNLKIEKVMKVRTYGSDVVRSKL